MSRKVFFWSPIIIAVGIITPVLFFNLFSSSVNKSGMKLEVSENICKNNELTVDIHDENVNTRSHDTKLHFRTKSDNLRITAKIDGKEHESSTLDIPLSKLDCLKIFDPVQDQAPMCGPVLEYSTCSCDSACKHIPPNTPIMNEKTLKDCALKQQVPVLGIDKCNYLRQGPSVPELEQHTLTIVMNTILGLIYDKWDGHMDGSIWPSDASKASSMIGVRRMNNLQFLLEEAIRLNVPGDFIETGVWRGGASIFAATVFKVYGQTCPSTTCRRVFVADSFEGIPAVDVINFPADSVHDGAHLLGILKDNSMERVQETFKRFGVLTNAIVWLPGWFKDTLPKAKTIFTSFAVARLDGDTYESTWQALENIYDYVSIGGFIIIDDYTSWIGCRMAVDDFRAQNKIYSEIRPVYHEAGETVNGVWWQKRE
jgi:hypothetical protein